MDESERKLSEERKRREEETAKRAIGKTIITQLQCVPPTGKDIVPFRTYELPGKNEVLDCPRSKVLFLVPMMDTIKTETNPDLGLAIEYKRTRDFYHKHVQSKDALFSRSIITHLVKFKL